MTLQVPFEQFAAAVRRYCAGAPVFVAPSGRATLATAADPGSKVVVACVDHRDIGRTREALKTQGFDVLDGTWTHAANSAAHPELDALYVAAVAYKSKDEVPGVWVDAYTELPTQAVVLKAFYDDFKTMGALGEVSFEEFVRLSTPNVVITTPEQLAGFASTKECG